jgi:hypothetical protein
MTAMTLQHDLDSAYRGLLGRGAGDVERHGSSRRV